MNNPDISMLFNVSDFASLGLVICVSIFSELSQNETKKDNWKTIAKGVTIVFLVLYGILFALYFLLNEIIYEVNIINLRIMTILLTIVNFIVGWSIFDRTKKRPAQ